MVKNLAFAGLLVAMGVGAAMTAVAQTEREEQPIEREAPINSPYITGTGATVPNPGKSQSGGTTPLDRGIQQRDNQIDNSICRGC